MANSKWKLFEYEYSIEEFIMGFVVVFVLSFLLLASLNSKFSMYEILALSVVIALILGGIWTYLKARILFALDVKRK
jgi:multisubunit Na+/H+ antiporter MnhE subunit